MALWLEGERRGKDEVARDLIREMGHGKSTHYRWKKNGTETKKTGPKGPDGDVMIAMIQEIEELDHVKRRTWGTEYIYQSYETVIPKSVIHRAIEEARKQKNRQERAADRRYEFAAPDIAWSEDFIEVQQGGKVLRIQDDFSRMAFGGEHRTEWTGADVTRFLDAAFRRYGRPLFFKHDLGGEFKDGIFQAFLRGNRVIAFPSPPYSPWYNGKMERQNGAVRYWLARAVDDRPTLEQVLEEIRLSQMDNNMDRKKDVLDKRTPHDRYANTPRVEVDREALYAEWDRLKEKLIKERYADDPTDPARRRVILEKRGELMAMRIASIVLLNKYRMFRYTVGPEVPEM